MIAVAAARGGELWSKTLLAGRCSSVRHTWESANGPVWSESLFHSFTITMGERSRQDRIALLRQLTFPEGSFPSALAHLIAEKSVDRQVQRIVLLQLLLARIIGVFCL